MLSLDSARWSQLTHAYGTASDIPALLRELASLPPDEGQEAEPYFSLWSSLCHQSDVYTASYAAVPHIVSLMASAPARAPWTLFLLIACIEIARAREHAPEIPSDLREYYLTALQQIPHVAGLAARQQWDWWYCGAAVAAIAAAKGQHLFAEAILCLKPENVQDVLKRYEH